MGYSIEKDISPVDKLAICIPRTEICSGGFRGVRGVQMHPPLAASNLFLHT